MKTKALISCSALSLTALMASGCYTVLSSPYEAASLHDEDLARAKTRDVEAPTVGQFDDRDYMDDLYRYPGVRGGYGGYGGYGMATVVMAATVATVATVAMVATVATVATVAMGLIVTATIRTIGVRGVTTCRQVMNWSTRASSTTCARRAG